MYSFSWGSPLKWFYVVGHVYAVVTTINAHGNLFTAGVAYIRVFIFYKHTKYHLSSMLKK